MYFIRLIYNKIISELKTSSLADAQKGIITENRIKEEIIVDLKTDLVRLCSNCHKMVYRKKGEAINKQRIEAINYLIIINIFLVLYYCSKGRYINESC